MKHEIIPIKLMDQRYPDHLRQIHRPPKILYCQGGWELLTGPCLAIVGTRRASDYGCRVARMLAQDLVDRQITIVSGLAYGIDLTAQEVAMDNKVGTIAVMAAGLNMMRQGYKARIIDRLLASGGLLVSEMSPDLPPRANLFAVRNRLISGLSAGVIVVEAPSKSGALITASLAMEENRPVMVVPGGIFAERSAGCLELIKQGACLIRNYADVAAELAWKFDTIRTNMVESFQTDNDILELITAEGMTLEELINRWPDKVAIMIERVNLMLIRGKLVSKGEKIFPAKSS